jgi:hypothetical protein
MGFDRNRLPDATRYYTDTAGLVLLGHGKWRTARCAFHSGSDSMRINVETGAFVCMARCGAKGGDVLAYHMAEHGMDFVQTAKSLGAWVNDGKDDSRRRPTLIPLRDMLSIVSDEVVIASLVAADLAQGREVSETDRARLIVAAGRIGRIADEVRHAQ